MSSSQPNANTPHIQEITVVSSNVAPSTVSSLSEYEDTASRLPQTESQSQTTITDQPPPITKQPSKSGGPEYKKLNGNGDGENENVHYRQKYTREESECSEFWKDSLTCYGNCTLFDDCCNHDSYMQNFWGCVCMCCTKGNIQTCLTVA